MAHLSAVLALGLRDRFFSERKISNRSRCRAIAFKLVCLLSLFGSSVYGQAPVGDAFDESTLNTSLWTVKAPVSGSAALSGGIISAQSEGNQTGPVPPGGLIWWQAPTDRRNGAWIKHTIDDNMIDVHRIATGGHGQEWNHGHHRGGAGSGASTPGDCLLQ